MMHRIDKKIIIICRKTNCSKITNIIISAIIGYALGYACYRIIPPAIALECPPSKIAELELMSISSQTEGSDAGMEEGISWPTKAEMTTTLFYSHSIRNFGFYIEKEGEK